MTRKTDERKLVDKKALERMNRDDFLFCTHAQIAGYLGIHQTNITRAYASSEDAEGVSPALLNAMVAKGYLDAHEVNEVLKVEVTPCPECGEAHTVPWCTDKEGEPVKAPYNRKSASKREPRVRFSGDVSPREQRQLSAMARQFGVTNGMLLRMMLISFEEHVGGLTGEAAYDWADAATEE